MPALDDSVITKAEVEREDTAAVGAGLDVLEEPDRVKDPWWRRIGSLALPCARHALWAISESTISRTR